jgi:hypothetical protein
MSAAAAADSRTRSGGRYGLRSAASDDDDDEDAEDLARGRLRTGTTFRRVNRGQYASMEALRRAHARLFSQEATFVMTGECDLLPTPAP